MAPLLHARQRKEVQVGWKPPYRSLPVHTTLRSAADTFLQVNLPPQASSYFTKVSIMEWLLPYEDGLLRDVDCEMFVRMQVL